MRRSVLPALALAAAALSLSSCTGGSGPAASASPSSTDASTPAATSGTTSSSPTGSPSPTLATLPADQCLTGDWRVVRFVAASEQTYGTGEGGDVTIAFAGQGYTLSGDGKKPITLTLGGNTGKLTVEGRSTGSYTLSDATATFTPGSSSGSGTVTLGGASKRLTMDEVTNVIGLSGAGQVACTAQAMTITLSTVRLDLGRV